MAVQAQLGGLAGILPPNGLGGGLADELWALRDYGALMSAAAATAAATGNKGYQYDCAAAGVASAAQSELTCNGGGGGGGGVALPSRKRGREEADFEHYVASSSSAALLPFPGMQKAVAANRTVQSPAAMASTSGRPDTAASLVSELCRHGAEVDALVRAECDRLRAGLEQAHKRQRQAVAVAATAWAARALREKEAELHAARRRAAELEERLRQAAAESQAWCGVARTNEAVASGLRAALDALLLRSGAGAGATTAAHLPPADEGFGDSGEAAADDAESCCFVEAAAAAATPARKWACRACGGGEASVLLLPCRHLCVCKACEPRADACPVCLAAKNAAIHVAGSN